MKTRQVIVILFCLDTQLRSKQLTVCFEGVCVNQQWQHLAQPPLSDTQSVFRLHTFLPFVLIICNVNADHLHSFLSLQAAMCYVHVAALVAEYLHRKSKSTPSFLQWEQSFNCAHSKGVVPGVFCSTLCSQTGLTVDFFFSFFSLRPKSWIKQVPKIGG